MSHSRCSPQNRGTIGIRLKATLALLICALTYSWAQTGEPPRKGPDSRTHAPRPLTVSREDGMAIIAAVDTQLRQHRRADCSHLVHTIYERAGFSYPYADSSDLYRGSTYFLRVKHPQAGDLVVWRGHVGIVVSPARHTFFSALSHGPGTDKYDAQYWKRRGPLKFYRYIKAP